jgi:spore coat assembly protein SafA
MVTFRDEFAGFEIDYPEDWSVVDVASELKQQSPTYSITLMSWEPEEPGRGGIPEDGSKVDIGVSMGAGASLEAAVEARRAELAQAVPANEITFEEPWDLPGGLQAVRWIVQPVEGDTLDEVIAAIGGNRIIVSGLGDPALFEQIAMTLRPLGVSVDAGVVETAASEPAAAATPDAAAATPDAAAAKEMVVVPMITAGQAGATGAGGEAAAAATGGQTTVYTVRQGDTLAKIAARFGVSLQAILRANPQIRNPDRIYIGQRINIPTSGGSQPPPPTFTRVNIYMIGIGGGSMGCGDSVVAVLRDVPKTAAPLTAALNTLLAQKSGYYGESGLYNALHQSNLAIASITRSGGAWTIRLSGTLVMGGICDAPRIEAQLEQTALQFSTVQSVQYFVNGRPLEDLLSGK